MNITVNKTNIEIFSGATVIDALRAYYATRGEKLPAILPQVTDSFGNRVAPDGALSDGNKLTIKRRRTMKTSKPNRFLPVMLATLIIFVTSCTTTRKVEVTPVPVKTVEILAVNDMHGAIDNFPRLAFIVDSLRAIYPDMLLVSGGDNQTGNPVNDMHPEKGMPIIQLMNALGFDLSAVGNHEFDSKLDGFARITQRAKFPFLCANLTPPANGGFKIEPYKIMSLSNGVKLVFTSVLHINLGGIPDSHPDNLKGFTFTDPFETAPKYLHLRDSADALIYVNHFGFENDVALAQQLPHRAIDLIIGGHSHTRVEKEQIHNGIFITQAERKLKYATLIKLTVKPDGQVHRQMQLLTVGNGGSKHTDIQEKVDKFNDNPTLTEQIAIAEDDFTSYEQVGYLMADAMRASAKTDIALINPGGVRIDHLAKGNVSVLDVYSMDPFGNETVLFRLTGPEIKAMLTSAFQIDEFAPIYPSGMKSRYTLADDGNAKDIQLFTSDGTPLDMTKTYTVAMNSYMASVYKYEHKDPGTGLFLPTAESMIEYLRGLKRVPSYNNEKRIEMDKR